MNATPLYRPDGTLHAYACGQCGVVGGSSSVRGSGDPARGFIAVQGEETRDDAERCCTCACGSRMPGGEFECEGCRMARCARLAAEQAAREALPPDRVAADTDGETPVASYEVTFGLSYDETETVTVTTTEDGRGFFSAWLPYRNKRAPQLHRDFSHSLSRREADAFWHVVCDVSVHIQAEDIRQVARKAVGE